MTAIWLLSTRGRPDAAQATVDACQSAGMTSRGAVYVDGGRYPKLKLPRNWTLHEEPAWLGLQGSMQWVFDTFPDAAQYGWLADDTRPRTKAWDKHLEHAAGAWNLSYAKDLWMSEHPASLNALENGRDLSSGLCFGGDLVRTVGWWALPGVVQAGIDTAWTELVRPLSLHRYTPSVVIEHLHYKAGKRLKDHVDDGAHINVDVTVRNRWVWSARYRNTLRRLSKHVPLGDEVTAAIRQSKIDELWGEGTMPAARLQRIQEGDLDIDVEQFEPEVQRSYPDPEPSRLDPPRNSQRPGADVS